MLDEFGTDNSKLELLEGYTRDTKNELERREACARRCNKSKEDIKEEHVLSQGADQKA